MIGRRYLLQELLGVGGMGTVYRALDRLTSETVALKQVIASTDRLQFGLSKALHSRHPNDLAVALAQEFKLLSSLRHPNIISVLDYGFHNSQPFFTMELLPAPRTITEAGAGQPLSVQINLLMQLLQSLTYLHRRGIIHRDLKPSNVLVVEAENGLLVKTLDFGLSIAPSENADHDSSTAGTLGYMAPEALTGGLITAAADLYAVGVIAYELFTGEHPFDHSDIVRLIHNIFESEPDYARLPEALASVLQRLMVKAVDARYDNAADVIIALSAASGQPVPPETAAIRESYLQAAQLIGRDYELTQLTRALDNALSGAGSAWLIGGESGVGKTRLLEELRALGLVRGALVLRGQCLSEGGPFYAPWRPALRWLSLFTPLDDLEARVLKALVPDIGDLIGHETGDAPELPPALAQERLINTLLAVFKRQTQPILLILEDLHWANESIEVLARLSKTLEHLPLLIVGSFRDEESPHLPDQLPHMKLLKLKRLSPNGIARLSEAMIGEAGRLPHVVELLNRETEGNVFFIVEVVRALAEEAGQLERIGKATLPQHVFTGGVQKVIERRLNRVPPEARPLLEFAAVAGYYIDVHMLEALAPREMIDTWLNDCLDAKVLDVGDTSERHSEWRFAHEKLRTGLLATLGEHERRALHQQVALTIETVYGETPEQIAKLAYHWQMAGSGQRAADVTLLAARQAAHSGAYHEAAEHYLRALLYVAPDDLRRIDITLELTAISAYHPPENLLELLQSALTLAQQAQDNKRYAHVLGSLGSYHHAKGQTGLAIAYFERCIALADTLRLERALLLPYNIIGRTRALAGNFPAALQMLQRGVALAEKFHDDELLAASLAYCAQAFFLSGQPDEGWDYALRALHLSQNTPNRFAADLAVIGWGLAFSGQFERATEYLEHGLRLARELGL
ncbi:MAG: protein kinase [Chloroflexi bacterium]|nr:protein kinase [Chloroflexota bacterium]